MNDITGLVLTFNEAPNIERTLGRLSWLGEVIVVDSHSTDGTVELAAAFPNVRVVKRAFTTLAEQWNFGLEQCGISSEWVLALDADYVLTDAVIDEIRSLPATDTVDGYRAQFDYCIDGRPLRGAAYPPVTILYRRRVARVHQDGHAHRVRVTGAVAPLRGRVYHDDRKSLSHWLGAQTKYMALEAIKLTTVPRSSLALLDRLRRWLVIAPPLMFVYCYFVRGGILDGSAGLFYALQRATAEGILSLFLLQRYIELASRPNSARRAG